MKDAQTLLLELSGSRLPRYEELPTLELYKDQLVELTNEYLAPFCLGEKALTDTMVNNYVKLKVIAPPVKKRYRREQLAQVMLTCLLKQVLSIAQVRYLLDQENQDGSIQAGYNYACEELERAMSLPEQKSPSGEGQRSALLDYAVWSFVHKLRFEIEMYSQTQE